MILCVDTLTEEVSYVERVKKVMVLLYLLMTCSVLNVLPRTMAGHYIYLLDSCQ